LFEDYKIVGFFMIPTGKPDNGTAVQIIMYTIWTVLVSIIPVFGYTGDLKLSLVGAVLVFILGIVMLIYAFKLFKERSVKAAKQLMLSSVFYITMLQIIYVADKFLR
ncbi:MAG: protoheme IX farnesyltransferase, partial [Winogradskyella sp.]|nr:protoheme IX farnesyltransferase [Winogradskyella sp.]